MKSSFKDCVWKRLSRPLLGLEEILWREKGDDDGDNIDDNVVKFRTSEFPAFLEKPDSFCRGGLPITHEQKLA